MAAVTPAILQTLQTGFKAKFQEGFKQMNEASAWKRVATLVPSSSRDETYGWLGKIPAMREWIGDRVIKDIASHGYNIINKDWETTVGVDRNDIEDDNLGVYAPLMMAMGQEAAQQPDRLVFKLLLNGFTELCYDNQYFFDTDHPAYDEAGSAITVSNMDSSGGAAPYWFLMDTRKAIKPLIFQERKKAQFVTKTDPNNSDHVFMKKEYVYGAECRSNAGFGFWQMAYASNAPLDGDSLSAALQVGRGLRDENGDPLGIRYDLLVVGSDYSAAADRTVKTQLEAGGGSNPNFNKVDVLDTTWLG